MKIILNNRPENIDATELTIKELLKYKNFTFRMLVIKINGKLIKKDQYETATIKDGDKVSVLHLVSGG
jgi:thiamine biosynthesis protein ThiS